ncbi:MAG: sulfatase [Planctomycetota bacterium]
MSLLLRIAPLVLAPLLAACGDASDERPSVVLVVGDTLRADKLTCLGGPEGLTPYIDRIAASGARFDQARAHAPWTLPSVASLLTSLHPREHGAGGRLTGFTKLADDVRTVVASFQEQGYSTHAIVNVLFLDPDLFGVTREFDTVDEVAPRSNVEMRSAAETTRAALDWLDENADDGPFLLLVHYFDPHCVYAPPRVFRERWAEEADRASDWTFGTRPQMLAIRRGELTPEPRTIQRAQALYDGEVSYLDAEIGRLDDGLAVRGLVDDTVFVLTGDHGEEFLDHAGFEHGHTLYDELVHVPLIVRAPGRVDPTVVSSPVRHIDVAPTLLELCGLPPDPQFVGRSLVPLARGEAEPPRATLAHGNMWALPRTSWTAEGWKLIVRDGAAPELYHVAEDPRERTNLAEAQPERLASMRAELEAVESRMQALQRGEAADLDAQARDVLGGLGYGSGK